jgi:hypothetical protein
MMKGIIPSKICSQTCLHAENDETRRHDPEFQGF